MDIIKSATFVMDLFGKKAFDDKNKTGWKSFIGNNLKFSSIMGAILSIVFLIIVLINPDVGIKIFEAGLELLKESN